MGNTVRLLSQMHCHVDFWSDLYAVNRRFNHRDLPSSSNTLRSIIHVKGLSNTKFVKQAISFEAAVSSHRPGSSSEEQG